MHLKEKIKRQLGCLRSIKIQKILSTKHEACPHGTIQCCAETMGTYLKATLCIFQAAN